MKRAFKLVIFILMALAAACTPVLQGPQLPAEAVLSTSAAQTVAVEQTQSMYETLVARLSATPEPSPTRTRRSTATDQPTATTGPTSTPVMATFTPVLPSRTPTVPATRTPIVFVPTITNTALPCNWAAFVEDVTVPDNSVYGPGHSFTKTWKIRNIGGCEWTPEYQIVFSNGNVMGGPGVQDLNKSVRPGQTVDISIDLVAPRARGTYTGFWLLRSPGGEVFGMGSGADGPMWTRIKVEGGDDLEYDFVSAFCEAEWRSNNGVIDCPTDIEDAANGYVDITDDPRFEGGRFVEDWAIVVVPGNGDKGYISGKYPPFQVSMGDDFAVELGCASDRPKCEVEIRLDYIADGAPVETLAEWKQVYDGKTEEVILDLNELDGKWVQFILHVSNLGSSEDDRVIWLAPAVR